MREIVARDRDAYAALSDTPAHRGSHSHLVANAYLPRHARDSAAGVATVKGRESFAA